MTFSFVCNGQNSGRQSEREYREFVKAKAIQDIQQLKDGVLLFRLKTNSEETAYYKKYGNQEEAERIQTKTNAFNVYVINTISTNFDFCKVLFFPDTLSRELLNGNTDAMYFYNEQLELYEDLSSMDSIYYIAEIGVSEGDTTSSRKDTYISSGDNGAEWKEKTYGNEGLGIQGFIIRDSTFKQLTSPFPYCVKIGSLNPSEKRLRIRTKKWNELLNLYYLKSLKE